MAHNTRQVAADDSGEWRPAAHKSCTRLISSLTHKAAAAAAVEPKGRAAHKVAL